MMTAQRPESFQIISSLRYDPELPGAIAQYVADGYPDQKDSPYYLLLYHRDRLLNAAIHFNWPEAITFLEKKDLSQFSQTLDASIPDRTKPWRLRVALDANGSCSVDVHPTAPLCSPLTLLVPSSTTLEDGTTTTPQPAAAPWRLYIDSQPTTPSAFTTHKTTARDEYTAARQRAGITSPQEPAEVLVVNGRGEIMEGSITTPYFRRRRCRRGAAGSAVDEETKTPVWVTPPLSSGGNAGTTRRYALERGFCVEQVVRAEELVDGEECWLSNGVRGFMRAVVVLRK